MGQINYLHVSGLAVVGLIVASIAQHTFKEPPHHRTSSQFESTLNARELSAAERVTAEAEGKRIAAIRDRGRQDASQQLAQRQAEVHKEAAWQSYYKVPAACLTPESTAMFNACADEHIVARKRFEADYRASGKKIDPYTSTIAAAN